MHAMGQQRVASTVALPSTGRIQSYHASPGIRLSEAKRHGASSRARALKRLLDIALAGVALSALAVPLLLIAMLIKLTSAGPALYRQQRVGLGGQRFFIWKFRSMHVDAERFTGAIWARRNDPRVTRLGYFLREFYLDELPQLWNVLRGDMSLVGPRPERPEFVVRFQQTIPQYSARLSVLPGMTGWAQVNGWRGSTCLNARIQHDLDYIQHWSMIRDAHILCLTIRSLVVPTRSRRVCDPSSNECTTVGDERCSHGRIVAPTSCGASGNNRQAAAPHFAA